MAMRMLRTHSNQEDRRAGEGVDSDLAGADDGREGEDFGLGNFSLGDFGLDLAIA